MKYYYMLIITLFIGLACSNETKTDTRTPSSKITIQEHRLELALERKKGVSTRIIGGDEADPNSYRFFVKFQSVSCGGSLIGQSTVLTAAHCAEFILKNSSVTVGHGGYAVDMTISWVDVHPDYDSDTLANDVAVISLKSTVCRALIDKNFPGDEITPISVAYKYFSPGTNLKIIGFGTTIAGEDDSVSDNLLEAAVTYKDSEVCNSLYQGMTISDDMMCAAKTGMDTCQGDSGGPLFYKNKNGNFVQVGITSWGIGCAHSYYPGVYSRVSYNLNWIKSFLPEPKPARIPISVGKKKPLSSKTPD